MATSRLPAAVALALAGLALFSPRPGSADDWIQTSLPNTFRYALATGVNGEIYAAAGSTVHVSTDDGVTWAPAGSLGLTVIPHTLATAPSGALFAADFALGVVRSDDGGVTWSPGLVEEGCNGFGVNPVGVAFAGLTYTGNGRVHRSTDDGGTWQSIPLPDASASFATECFGFDGGNLAYAGAIDGFYRSTDGGLTWTRHNTGLTGLHVRTMAVASDRTVFIQTLLPAQLDGFYRSSDLGQTWERRPNAPYFSALRALADGTLLGLSDAVAHRSSDQGATWTPLASGIASNEDLKSIALTRSGHLLVGGRRVYRSSFAVVGVAPSALRAPGIELRPSQPNPAAGRSRVTFALATAADVDLALFDLAGRRVATLARGARGPGEHSAGFDAARFAPGRYTCRLNAGGDEVTRPVIVLH